MSTGAVEKESSAREARDFSASLITNHEALIMDFKRVWKLGSLDVKPSLGALMTERTLRSRLCILDTNVPDSDLFRLALQQFADDRTRRWYLLVPGVPEHSCESLLPPTMRIFNRENTTAKQIVDAVRTELEREGEHHILSIRYVPEISGVAVHLGTGRSYFLRLSDLPEADSSSVASADMGEDDSYFIIRQESGNWFEVPWDDVLYHCEPTYEYYKDRQVSVASDDERIGSRLREARKMRGLTVAELARRAGMKRPNLSRLEHGRHRPSLDTLERLAEALEVPVARLVARQPADKVDSAGEPRRHD